MINSGEKGGKLENQTKEDRNLTVFATYSKLLNYSTSRHTWDSAYRSLALAQSFDYVFKARGALWYGLDEARNPIRHLYCLPSNFNLIGGILM